MVTLEALRKERNDKYPIRPMWNALFAGLVLGHETTAALIRELRRNAELRSVCGFDPLLEARAVPPDYVFSRFQKRLVEHREMVMEVFRRLVTRAAEALPDFGTHLAADGKAVHSQRRSDPEAAAGFKKDTTALETIVAHWFGFKIHLLCDAVHELPVAFEVTAADEHESPHLVPLVEQAFEQQPLVAERALDLAADKGLDDGEDKRTIYEDHGVRPLIPPRDLWNGEYKPLEERHHDTIYLSPAGQVCCRVRPFEAESERQFCAMEFCGHEPERGTIKFRCPAAAFGIECSNKSSCRSAVKDQGHGRTIRVPLDRDRRLLMPTPSGTNSFKKAYARRTSVERLFYRLDHMFGLEPPLKSTGLERAKLRVTLGLSAMVATALAWLEEERPDMARSRLQRAA